MRRKSVLLTIGLILLIVGAVCGTLIVLLKGEPEFYTSQADEPSAWERGELASALLTRVQDLKNDIRSKPEWGTSFRANDLNSFFRENLSDGDGYATLLPSGFHSPRVSIDGDRIKLGMRYGNGYWSTIVWLEMRAWLVKNDTNVIALELCGMRAGNLSIGCQTMLDSLSEAAHDSNVDVTWYRNGSNPVGLFRFYADQLRPTTQIHTLKIADGTVTVAGRTKLENSVVGGPGSNPIGE